MGSGVGTDGASRGGTYTLLIELADPASLAVGALGEMQFDRRWYAYTGSALGPGGFARIDRHRELAAGQRDVRHWHVDYLLGESNATIAGVWTSPGDDRECAIATALSGDRIAGFGASDCDCPAHLVGVDDRATLTSQLSELHVRREPGRAD